MATQELEKQLDAIRAKLQIFEAKQVPFSAEELALFKQPPIKVASAQTNAPAVKKKSNELPPGAGPLVAEALRAIDTGRLAEAEKKYQDVLRQDENNTYILANLAAVQMDQDKVAEAESTLKKALETDAQDPVSLYLMGGLKLRQEIYDVARRKRRCARRSNSSRAGAMRIINWRCSTRRRSRTSKSWRSITTSRPSPGAPRAIWNWSSGWKSTRPSSKPPTACCAKAFTK
jgi:tetratricopeptide (TPR) repeat protein